MSSVNVNVALSWQASTWEPCHPDHICTDPWIENIIIEIVDDLKFIENCVKYLNNLQNDLFNNTINDTL